MIAIDGGRSRIVGRKRTRQITVAIQHRSQIANSPVHVLDDAKGTLDPERRGGRRHQLHQSLGPDRGDRVRLEIRLGGDHGLDQPRLDPMARGHLRDQAVIVPFAGNPDLGPRGDDRALLVDRFDVAIASVDGGVGEMEYALGVDEVVDRA